MLKFYLLFFIIFFQLLPVFILPTQKVYAADPPTDHACLIDANRNRAKASFPNKAFVNEPIRVTVTFNALDIDLDKDYWVAAIAREDISQNVSARVDLHTRTAVNNQYQVPFDLRGFSLPVSYNIGLLARDRKTGKADSPFCTFGEITAYDKDLSEVKCQIDLPNPLNPQDNSTEAVVIGSSTYNLKKSRFRLQVDPFPIANGSYNFYIFNSNDAQHLEPGVFNQATSKQKLDNKKRVYGPYRFERDVETINPEQYFDSKKSNLKAGETYLAIIEATKKISSNQYSYYCATTPFKVTNGENGPRSSSSVKLAPGTAAFGAGISAAGQGCDTDNPLNPDGTINIGKADGVMTAIGCVPTNPPALIRGLLKVVAGLSGGVALLMMITGVYQMITSAGNPEGVKKGSGQITSAVIGLLVIIFSVLLMQVIGVNILNIPGFTP